MIRHSKLYYLVCIKFITEGAKSMFYGSLCSLATRKLRYFS